MGWNHLPYLFHGSKQKRSWLLLFPTAAVLPFYKTFTRLLCYKYICTVTSERRVEGSGHAWVGRRKGSSRRDFVTLRACRTRLWKGSVKVIFSTIKRFKSHSEMEKHKWYLLLLLYGSTEQPLITHQMAATWGRCQAETDSHRRGRIPSVVAVWARTFKASFYFCLTGWLLLHIMLFPLTTGVHKNSSWKTLVTNC